MKKLDVRARGRSDKEVIMSRWTPCFFHSLYSSVWKSAACEERREATGEEEENDAGLEGEEREVVFESAAEANQVTTLEHAEKTDEAKWSEGGTNRLRRI